MAVCGKCIHKNVCGFCKEMGFENVVRANDFKCKDYIPTADVEEVRHGRWLPQIVAGVKAWDCSECKTIGSPHWKRCPIC